MSTPLGGSMPSRWNSSGYFNGSSIISLILTMASLIPPRSSYVTSGTSSFTTSVASGNS